MSYWRVKNLAGSRTVEAHDVLGALAAAGMADVTNVAVLAGAPCSAERLMSEWDEDAAYDFEDVAALISCSGSRARELLYRLHAARELHIAEWMRPAGRGRPRPRYARGAGIDAPRPRQSRAEVLASARNYKARIKIERDVQPVPREKPLFSPVNLNWKAPR